jgi:hypothetical protein
MKKESILSILLPIFFTFIFGNGKIFASFLFDTLADFHQESEAIVLTANDVVNIKGGLSSGGGGLFKTTVTPAAPSAVNIQLSNVPYIYQENDYPSRPDRSVAYCGLASALMVRTKLKYKETAYSNNHSLDYEGWKKLIDGLTAIGTPDI